MPSIDLPSFDLEGATGFVTANPLALVAGIVAVAVPFIASRAFAGPTSFGSVSAVEAFEKLSNAELNAQLLDIRAIEDIKAEGSPNLKALKKTAVNIVYTVADDTFVDKVFLKFKDAENTTLYVLDRFDGSASDVAKILANSGFKSAYAIKGGAEGQNGWLEKELPWSMPSKAFNLNLDNLKNILKDGERDVGGLVPTTLGVAAAAGVGIAIFSEAETTLQLLGTVAVLQLFVRKFLFADDRKKSLQDIKSFLDTKVAPKEFVEELKEVGRVLIPKDGEVQAAVQTGATVLEKKLNVTSVTPETLAGKGTAKLGDEAEKLGLKTPDLEGVKSDIESSVELVTSDLQSGAKDLQSNVETATSDLKSGVKDLQSVAEEAKSAVNGSAAPAPVPVEDEKVAEPSSNASKSSNEVTPFFESDIKAAIPSDPVASAVSSDENLKASQAAFEGDELSAFAEEGVGENITAKK